MTTTLPPSPETWAQLPPPPPQPRRRFFSWRSDRPRWQVIALFGAAVLVGVGIGAPTGGSTEDLSDEVASLESELVAEKADGATYRDQRDDAVAELSDVRAEQADAETALLEREAALDARETELEDRSGQLDTREGEIAGAEAAAEANSFDNGTFVVGTDIQPGTYRSAGPTAGAFGMGYWARLSGLGGSLDEIIANDLPSGPTTVTISASDVAFESTDMQTWTKVG